MNKKLKLEQDRLKELKVGKEDMLIKSKNLKKNIIKK